MSTIAVISDVHSNLPALEAVLCEIEKIRPDFLINLGDTIGYATQAKKCLSLLAKLPFKQITVRGNHEQDAALLKTSEGLAKMTMNPSAFRALNYSQKQLGLQKIDELSKLPTTVNLPEFSIGAAHGSYFYGDPHAYTMRKENVEEEMHENPRIILLGHVHKPFFYTDNGDEAVWQKNTEKESVIYFDENERIVANPGSVGQPRDGDPRASFAILRLEGNDCSFQVRRIAYDIAAAARKIKKAGLPDFLADRLFKGR
jgi:predicted phosphodiesterase